MNCTIMRIPRGFKIRKKDDCNTFIEKCMCENSKYSIIVDNTQIIFHKDKDNDISVCVRYGDFSNIFNPMLEVARTKDNCYKETVFDYIWKYRKAINNEWFNAR